MGYHLGVDLGTTFVAAAIANDSRVEMFTLGDRTVVTPAVVFLGDDGGLVSGDAGDWLVPLGAIVAAQGVSDRAVPEVAWSAVSRLGLGSALRRLADEGAACVVATRGGARHEVVLTRVGRDFVEAETVADPAQRLLVALASIGAVQSREPG